MGKQMKTNNEMPGKAKTRVKRSIKTKLLASVLPVVLVSFVAVILILVSIAKSMITERSMQLIIDESGSYNHQIHAVIDSILSEAEVMHGTLETLNGTDEEIYEYLEYTVTVDERIPYGIYMGDKNNLYLDATWVPDSDYIAYERDWYIEGIKHDKMTLGEAYVDSQTGELCVSASCKLACRGNDNMVISTDIMLAEISAAVVEYTVLDNGYSYLLSMSDNGATVLAHPNAELLGTAAGTDSSDAMVAAVAGIYDSIDADIHEVEVDGTPHYVIMSYVEDTNWVLVSCVPAHDVNSAVIQMNVTAVGITAVVLVVLAVIIMVVVQSTIKPIQRLTADIDRMTSGDFTVEVQAKGEDEVAVMSKELSQFVATMRKIIGEITGVSYKLAGQADSSSNISGALYQSAESQSQAMRELNDTVEELSVSISEVATNATSLALIVNEAGEKGEAANEKMQSTVMVTRAGREDMERIRATMGEIGKSIEQLEAAVAKVGDSTGEITRFVEMIGSIASQTNLLSLNAAIEAARAGEAGKGFAVVAGEIRQLADTSTEAVTEISNITGGINSLIEETIVKTKESVEGIKESTILVGGACETFEQIFANITETSELVETMVENVRSVDEVATSVAAITEEQSASTEQILATAENLSTLASNVSDNSQTVATEAESIANTADLLSEHMKGFKVEE